jgi:hypothetical protein
VGAHEAVSRRPPISLYTIVARTHTYDVKVWDLSIVQGPFSVAPCQTLIVTIHTCCVAAWQAAGRRLGARDTLLAQLRAFADDYLSCFRNGVAPRSQRKLLAAPDAPLEPVLID